MSSVLSFFQPQRTQRKREFIVSIANMIESSAHKDPKGRAGVAINGLLCGLCVSKDLTRRSQRSSVPSVLRFFQPQRTQRKCPPALPATSIKLLFKSPIQTDDSPRASSRAARQNLIARAAAGETIEKFRGLLCLEKVRQANRDPIKFRPRSLGVDDRGSDLRRSERGAETLITCPGQSPLRFAAAGL